MNNKVKSLRRLKNMSQEELAKKADVSRQTIFAVENGLRIPTLRVAWQIAEALGSTVDDIFLEIV